MSNSALVTYTNISPNKNAPRRHKIDKITIHHMAGNLSVQRCGELFANPARQASSNYGIDSTGAVGLYVDEGDRAWTSGNADNDNRAVTIEVANCGGAPDWPVSDAAYATLLDLCEDICRRNGIERLNFTGDASGNLTMHRYFQATACPGPFLAARFPEIAAEVNRRLSGGAVSIPVNVTYQVFAKGRWLPNVVNKEDYAGIFGQPINGVYASADHGDLIYRVGLVGGGWLPEVKNREDYAGILGKPIDRVMVRSTIGQKVHVQAHADGRWLGDVTGYDEKNFHNGYAGIPGYPIDALYIWSEPLLLKTEPETPVEENDNAGNVNPDQDPPEAANEVQRLEDEDNADDNIRNDDPSTELDPELETKEVPKDESVSGEEEKTGIDEKASHAIPDDSEKGLIGLLRRFLEWLMKVLRRDTQ